MEWINGLYIGCFVFGLVFTVASFLLGNLADLAGLDGTPGFGHDVGHAGHAGHGHAGHSHVDSSHAHGQHNSDTDVAAGGLGWFNFNALILFVTWFGATGFTLTALNLAPWLVFGLAIVGGIVGYFIILLFLQKVLYASQTPFMRKSDYDLTGTVGKISSTIFEKGTGEIVFTKFGTRRSYPARSLDGAPISRETEVVVMRVENGIVYVEEFDKLLIPEDI